MDLKTYYDAVTAADAEVQAVMGEIDAAFKLGTPEGTEQALALRPKLDAAEAKAKGINELYVSMRDGSSTRENIASLFTPADPSVQGGQQSQATVLSRADFDKLSPTESMAFINRGGRITAEGAN